MSAFVLDTHAFIWLTENDSSLPDNLRRTINTADTVGASTFGRKTQIANKPLR